MGRNSKIEYVDATHNFWVGCTPVSPACKNCFARIITTRFGQDFSIIQRTQRFDEPTKWKTSKRILTCSMSDFFHEDVAGEWRSEAWDIIMRTPQHIYLILTKRPENVPQRIFTHHIENGHSFSLEYEWPISNVWLGTTVESRGEKWRVDVLRKIPAVVRWLSIEPLLGDLGELNLAGIGWIVCGGESGPGARPMHEDWARSVRDQCKAAGVPFFMKQMAKRAPIPKDLQIKEFPNAMPE